MSLVRANGATYLTGANKQLLFDGVFSYSYWAEGNRTARFIDVNANGLLDAVILKRQVSTGWEKVCGFFADFASFLSASLRPGGFAALRWRLFHLQLVAAGTLNGLLPFWVQTTRLG